MFSLVDVVDSGQGVLVGNSVLGPSSSAETLRFPECVGGCIRQDHAGMAYAARAENCD